LAKKTLENLSSASIAFSNITSNWQIKLWQIRSKSPNSPQFSPAKIFCYTVIAFPPQVYTKIQPMMPYLHCIAHMGRMRAQIHNGSISYHKNAWYEKKKATSNSEKSTTDYN